MKRLLITGLLLVLSIAGKAQLVLSDVNIETEVNGIFKNEKGQRAGIELNAQNQELIMSVTLSPALVGIDTVSYTAPLCMNLRGKFPYSDLDFFEDSRENKNFTFKVLITLNGVAKEVTLPFNLIKPLPGRFAVGSAMSIYPVFISFNFGIDPAEYDLERGNAGLKKKILISIPEGVINKNNDAINTARCRNLD